MDLEGIKTKMKERINGIKVNLEHEDIDTLVAMRGYMLEQHKRLTVDIERIEHAILAKSQPELDFDGRANYEHVLGEAVLRGELTAQEAYDALERYE
jgi:DNA-directed RNA polymerase subunit L